MSNILVAGRSSLLEGLWPMGNWSKGLQTPGNGWDGCKIVSF